MTDAWPALCTFAALALLLVLIIRWKFQAFVAILVVSLVAGLAAGMPPDKVLDSLRRGVGTILGGVTVILVLGAMLGRILDASGAAEVIARTLVNAFGVERASLAILLAAYLIGIPVLFNVGFLLLIPIMWQLQRDTGKSLLYFVLPLAFSLATAHSLIPPHPGIVGAVDRLAPEALRSTIMVETILFGTLMGIPIVLLGWLGPGRWWASRQHVEVPEQLSAKPAATPSAAGAGPSFTVCLVIVLLPLVQSLVGFGTKLLNDAKLLPAWMSEPLVDGDSLPSILAVLGHSPLAWLQFLGHPTMALLVPTGLAFLLLGRGMSRTQLSKLADNAIPDIGGIVLLFGAAGGFSQIIEDCGAGGFIAAQVEQLGQLGVPHLVVFYLVAVLMRIALGSATAAILLAAGLLQTTARGYPGDETLLVLAVANGVTFGTQPGDSGFWLIKEYCNLSVRDVMLRFNACRMFMSLTGLGLLLAYAALFPRGGEESVTLRYLRPAGEKLTLESEITDKRSKEGREYVSLTDRGSEKMTLTLRFDNKQRLIWAEALQETKQAKKASTLVRKDALAEVTRADGSTESFKLDGEPVVTTAPDWSDILQVIQRYDRKKAGKQEFPGLWIHPVQPARQLKFVVEKLGTDFVTIDAKQIVLDRFRVQLRSGAYVVWADNTGRVIKLLPESQRAAFVVLEGFAEATRELK